MNYKKGNLDEIFINKLENGPIYKPALVLSMVKEYKCSRKAVYNVINQLKESNIIAVHNKYVSLSLVWIDRQRSRIESIEKAYKANERLVQLFTLAKTKSVRYTFNSIKELDLFWTHAYTLLLEHNQNYDSQYLLTPHDFFLYALGETDNFWLQKNVKNRPITKLVISYAYDIDRKVVLARKRAHGSEVEYALNVNPLRQKSNQYYNLVGDYIFKAELDMNINQTLEMCLANMKRLPIGSIEGAKMKEIVNTKGQFSLIIERNSRKAEAMKQKLKKYFVTMRPL